MSSWEGYIEGEIGTAEYIRDLSNRIGRIKSVTYALGNTLSFHGSKNRSLTIVLNGEESKKPERVSMAVELASDLCTRYPLVRRNI